MEEGWLSRSATDIGLSLTIKSLTETQHASYMTPGKHLYSCTPLEDVPQDRIFCSPWKKILATQNNHNHNHNPSKNLNRFARITEFVLHSPGEQLLHLLHTSYAIGRYVRHSVTSLNPNRLTNGFQFQQLEADNDRRAAARIAASQRGRVACTHAIEAWI